MQEANKAASYLKFVRKFYEKDLFRPLTLDIVDTNLCIGTISDPELESLFECMPIALTPV